MSSKYAGMDSCSNNLDIKKAELGFLKSLRTYIGNTKSTFLRGPGQLLSYPVSVLGFREIPPHLKPSSLPSSAIIESFTEEKESELKVNLYLKM